MAAKAKRLRRGGRPRVLDLFAGCGGISLGFQAVGCEIKAALEIDEHAARSHALNFFRNETEQFRQAHARPHDITQVEPQDICDEFGFGSADEAFDFVVGGPPCQAYARVGRAKLREVAEHPEAFKVDPRGNLYLRYLHYVSITKPLAVFMENVPDILNYGGHNVVEEMVEALDVLGYSGVYTLLNAAFYGVPEMRDRVFLVAFRKELDVKFAFPEPIRHLDLPVGYAGSRAVALKNIGLLSKGWRPVRASSFKTEPPAVTAKEAIDDLPPITLHLEGKLKRGARRLDDLIAYDETRPLSEYGRMMRSWPDFSNDEGLYDHVIRCLPRDTDIFRNMPEGAEYPEAHRVATMLFEKAVVHREQTLRRKLSQEERSTMYRNMVPPYPISSFPNRWWKLRRNFPVRTLMAHIGKDTYSHIHYDSEQARVISVREAARLQSFPDGFRFSGTMNPAYRQVGNAVPPLMAKKLAEQIYLALRDALTKVTAVVAA